MTEVEEVCGLKQGDVRSVGVRKAKESGDGGRKDKRKGGLRRAAGSTQRMRAGLSRARAGIPPAFRCSARYKTAQARVLFCRLYPIAKLEIDMCDPPLALPPLAH
jgi:hypothetical protein